MIETTEIFFAINSKNWKKNWKSKEKLERETNELLHLPTLTTRWKSQKATVQNI